MKKSTVALLSVICLLAGTVLGFLIAPAKAGVGNNCGNTTHNNYKFFDSETDSEEE